MITWLRGLTRRLHRPQPARQPAWAATVTEPVTRPMQLARATWYQIYRQMTALPDHLYARHNVYWAGQWQGFYQWVAWQTADRNAYRREMGLPQLPAPAIPAHIAFAA